MIEVKNISKKLGDFELKNISFSLEIGDYFVILGKSGAGKSVLLEIISGLISPDNGKVYIDSKEITNTKIQKRNLGLVFQNHSLFPHLSVKDNILYSLKAKHLLCDETKQKINSLTDKLNITHLLKNKTTTLSIGESQRVALARTLVTSPQCLLLDEPLSSLDAQTKAETKSLLRKINKNIDSDQKKPQTIIHVTHDYEEAISLATKIAVIENGIISQIGTPEEVFRHPKTTFIANFIGIKNFYKGELSIENNATVFKPKIKTKNSDFKFFVTSDSKTGFGSLIIRSEDITISNTLHESSARNIFKGKIIDIENVRLGIEITIQIEDLTISALITKPSYDKLKLDYNKEVYLSFKASAAKFLKG
jgi:molybdate/tungstate transport system ATP-binding protein